MRPNKTQYYLNIAQAVALRGTCLRRNYGAVIVKNDVIQSTGYTGSPRGELNCCDNPEGCLRIKLNVPSGERYELCKSVHAETNAIISAGRDKCIDATMYLVGINAIPTANERLVSSPKPCDMCRRLIINAGIKEVITPNEIITY
jgi:dCMP deaminase